MRTAPPTYIKYTFERKSTRCCEVWPGLLFDQTVVHEITTEMTQSARGYFARLRLTRYVVHCNTPPIYMSVWYLLNPLAVGTQIGHSGWNLLIQMVTIDVV